MTSCMMSLMLLVGVPQNADLAALVEVTSRHEDLALVSAVAAAESAYNPTVTSKQGAQGLMQIMPKTGAWLYEAFGESCGLGKPEGLYSAGRNIAYGSCYLRHLSKLYKGDLVKVLIHYHSGGGGVRKLYKQGRIGPRTSTYVQRVLSYYFHCKQRRLN